MPLVRRHARTRVLDRSNGTSVTLFLQSGLLPEPEAKTSAAGMSENFALGVNALVRDAGNFQIIFGAAALWAVSVLCIGRPLGWGRPSLLVHQFPEWGYTK